MDESLKGRLLVAAPQLLEPNFFRTVVLMCAHDDDGGVGVILNRPSDAPVDAFLPTWSSLAAAPDVVFVGGPVSPEVAIGLGESLTTPVRGEAWTPVLGPVGMVDLAADAEGMGAARIRVFSGYAGWGGGQLENEISRGDWYVLPAAPGDGFSGRPDDLWSHVLRRQPGRLALLSTFPPDPSLN